MSTFNKSMKNHVLWSDKEVLAFNLSAALSTTVCVYNTDVSPLSPNINLQILLTVVQKIQTEALGRILTPLIFIFGDEFLYSHDLHV